MTSKTTERVSPTAYATGYFWYRHGLSHPAFATPQGRRLDRGFAVLNRITRRLSGFSLDALMLARHKGIDARLTAAIASGKVGQVIEVAAGLSPRGWAFTQKFPDLLYIETDLPAMAATKRELLTQANSLSATHQVIELDALATSGPRSLAEIAKRLDPKVGTAIITEGLMNYLGPDDARAVWRRFAATLRQFPHGGYFSDLYYQERKPSPALVAFGAILSAFVKGRMHVHFESAAHVAREMKSFGFNSAEAIAADAMLETQQYAKQRGGDSVRVLEAWV